MKTAYITDEIYLLHDTGLTHPESKKRLVAIEKAVAEVKKKMLSLSPVSVSEEILLLVHTPDQIEEVIRCSQSASSIDYDTVCSLHSYQAAKTAVGAGIVAIDGIKKGEFTRAFCAVRPPGHHATPVKSMGFCLFNNIAIAARYAQKNGYQKVMIIDFDVHHGNGTQDTFWEDDTVFYYSIHQFPYYPGTGSSEEKGLGDGEGFTLNRPLAIGSGDDVYLSLFEKDMQSVLDIFKPELIMISAGFDAHKDDPLAGMQVTQSGFYEMTKILTDISRQYCQGRIISMLEGGYNLQALANSVEKHLQAMMES